MGRKAVFLDVDGTYANDRGVVPGSAREAVVRARANGHLVFLSTGRPLTMLGEHILEAGFDGIIASAGGYIEFDGTVLTHRHIPVQDVRHVVDYFTTHAIDYFLEADTGLYGSPNSRTRLRTALHGDVSDENHRTELEKGFGDVIDSLVVDQDLIRPDIKKVAFFGADVPITVITDEFAGELVVLPASVPIFGPNSGEMSIPGVHKAAAIEFLLQHVGIAWEDTVAFGDGLNDVEMIEFVRIGVAMADAHPDVKALADATTAGPDDDGIHTSFTTMGLI